jgi:DNA-binding FadR family transcriptional regulator
VPRDLRLRPPLRSEQIARELAALIRNGEIGETGSLPSERILMERFNVGRSTIREALFAIRKMGLINVRAGAPAEISSPTPGRLIGELSDIVNMLIADDEGMQHFQRARALFEIGVAREVALAVTAERAAAIRKALHANRDSIGNQKRFVETDIGFHAALADAAGNPIYPAVQAAFMQWLREQRSISAIAGADQHTVYCEHERICEAVCAGNAASAMTAMQDHLDKVARNYWASSRSHPAVR